MVTRHGQRRSPLDPFKSYLRQRMAAGGFNANRLLHELPALRYTGGVTILNDFLKPYRPPWQPKAVVRSKPGPGKQDPVHWPQFAYTDLGPGGGKSTAF
mgnify:CR=1 FL=1